MLEPQYSVVAQGAYLTGRSHTRRPLAFHTIALKIDTYPERLLRCQLEEEFLHCQNMLQCTNIELVTGAACLPHVRARVRDALAFVKARPETDLLVLMDTHSDYENGELVHSVDKHGNAWTQDASEVFRHHLGPELWKRSLNMVGTKGMILLACGPAFTNQSHFETIKSLVSSKRLLFVIGFTAHSVQPSLVMPFMLRLIIQVYIHQMPVEQALEREIAHWTLLSHTPVVLVCWDLQGHLISRRYIASIPSGCVWGLSPRCGNHLCNPGPGDIKAKRSYRQGTNFFRFQCNRCGWDSGGYIPKPGWLLQLSSQDSLFSHHFPLTAEQEDYVRLYSGRPSS
ncbi:hypothetical protein BDR05DRAFT_425743 [Suillus weaverae]|nr:hypothetical protein BDR05DRAFT_425743 [Suillus weaverae]